MTMLAIAASTTSQTNESPIRHTRVPSGAMTIEALNTGG